MCVDDRPLLRMRRACRFCTIVVIIHVSSSEDVMACKRAGVGGDGRIGVIGHHYEVPERKPV